MTTGDSISSGGATIENILSFEKQFPRARVIRLEQNYRSTGNILDAANAVIRMNVARKGKELWTNNQRGGETDFVPRSYGDRRGTIRGKLYQGGLPGWRKLGDFAVLYRINAQSNQLEYALKRAGVPYKVVGGTKFFDRAEIKDITAYLCVLNNPEDNLRLTRIIISPPRGIGAKTVEEIGVNCCGGGDRSMYDVLRQCSQYPQLARSAAKLYAFVDMIEALRDL